MPKQDREVVPGFDVQVIYPQQGIPPQVNSPVSPPSTNGSGYVVMPVQGAVVPQPSPQVVQQPSVIVLTLGPKKDEDKPKKEVSSVFQRL